MEPVPDDPSPAPADSVARCAAGLKRRVLAAFRRHHRQFQPPWSWRQLAEITGIPHHRYLAMLAGHTSAPLVTILEAVVADASPAALRRLARQVYRRRRE